MEEKLKTALNEDAKREEAQNEAVQNSQRSCISESDERKEAREKENVMPDWDEAAPGSAFPDPDTVSSRSLAFLGDAVYELKIRTWALKHCNGKVGELNVITKELVTARAQAFIADALMGFFSEKEVRIFKRGRNVKSTPAPHSCTIGQYRRATGLEALLGYLYIQGANRRIDEIMEMAVKIYEKGK